MRRIVVFLLTLMMALSLSAGLADSRTPKPIEIIPYDEIPPVMDGQHHYLLLCVDQWRGQARPEV